MQMDRRAFLAAGAPPLGAQTAPSDRIRLGLIGAGGRARDLVREVRMAREAGAVVARFGAHVMRVETAAPVAAAVVLAAESHG